MNAILPLVPLNFGRYLEPFAGSAALYWKLLPQDALLNDINAELISFYEMIKFRPQDVFNAYDKIENCEETYYNIRKKFNGECSEIDQAAFFIYLNRFCFNGLYRTNLSGKFNVPYGGKKSGCLPSIDDILNYSSILARTNFSKVDFEIFLNDNVQAGDFIYLDPPFLSDSVRVFSEYGPVRFENDDILRLAASLDMIEKRGAQFILSYHAPEVPEWLAKWPCRTISVHRRVSGFRRGRGQVTEMLVGNAA